MKNWFNSLQARERQLVILAGVVVAVFFFYVFVWQPLDKNTTRLSGLVERQKKVYSAMLQMAPRIQSLQRVSKTSRTVNTNTSLTALIYQTGQAKLKGAQLKRVEEGQKRSVRVWVEKVAFDDMLLWLEELSKQYSISVDSLVADREAEAGRVNVRLTLKQS